MWEAQACAGCHAAQSEAWQGSQHALAMQVATPATVLGDFADAQLQALGVTTTFFREGDRFFVRTDGPDGTPQISRSTTRSASIRCSNT